MEKINIGCSVPNRNAINMSRNITLDEAINLIKGKSYDKEIEEDLVKQLKSRPSNSYENFLKNINSYILKIKERYERRNKKAESQSNQKPREITGD